jgi:hypothetical protein
MSISFSKTTCVGDHVAFLNYEQDAWCPLLVDLTGLVLFQKQVQDCAYVEEEGSGKMRVGHIGRMMRGGGAALHALMMAITTPFET